MKNQYRNAAFIALFILFHLAAPAVFMSCKDSSATTEAAKLEECKMLMDQEEWDDAIDMCEDVDTDEGWHLAAQAYMSRAGLSLTDLMMSMSSMDASSSPTDVLFENIPDTTDDRDDYRLALNRIMSKVDSKTSTMYFESLLLSSMLILKEMQDLLDLEPTTDGYTMCIDASGDMSDCSFSLDVTADAGGGLIEFSGLGNAFYDGICFNSDQSYDTTTETIVTLGDPPSLDTTVDHDVTVDYGIISETSPLYYNMLAYKGYIDSLDPSSDLVEALAVLDFWSAMNGGGNFALELDESVGDGTLELCHDGQITVPDVSDDFINDCEVLEYLTDPGW